MTRIHFHGCPGPSGRKSCASPHRVLVFFVAALLLFCIPFARIHGQVSVLTQHNDNGRTGQNISETILNTTNVNVASFGKLFSLSVQGQVFAQPLYVPNVAIQGVNHNVLIVATELDYVYAFDADSAALLWTASLIDSAHGATSGETPLPSSVAFGCTQIQPQIGISSTPVIDPVAATIYVEAVSMASGSNYFHRLHAIDLTTGNEKSQGPVVVTATVSGTGDGSVNGLITFDPLHHNSRSGLLLLNGSVFIAYASHCDVSPYHGWLFSYNASTFAQQGAFVTTPNGGLGGFWMGGAGIAADSEGNIYLPSGNGTFDATTVPSADLGDSVIKLSPSAGGFSSPDYFTPSDEACLAANDEDLGSGGIVVLPDQPGVYPHLLVAAGKEGAVYVVNRDQLTLNNLHFQNSSNCTTSDPEIVEESASHAIGGVFGVPAYWNSNLFFWASGDVLRSFPVVNGLPAFNQAISGAIALSFPGATPSISSNGTVAGSAIVWAADTSNANTPGPAVLHALNATNFTTELWNSTQAPGSRDVAANAVRFSVPTIANGKVYLGGNGAVTAYGLLAAPASLTTPSPNASLSGSSATFSWTPGAGVTEYQLWLGATGINTSNVFNSGSIAGTSVHVTGIPTSGVTLYATLWSRINGAWQSTNYTYSESGTPSPGSLTTPAPGAILPANGVTFQWTSGSGPTQYELWLGTSGIGSSNLYNSGELTATSAAVGSLPANGVTVYARLWSRINGAWQSADYTYTESGTAAPATLNSPVPNSIFTGSGVSFAWTSGTGVTQYELWLGTTGPNSSNLFNSGEITTTSLVVSGLPTSGVTVYASLWSRINGAWQYQDYLFTESGSPTPASLTAPASGSILASTNVAFTWTPGAGPTQYELWLGTTGPASSNLYNSGELLATSATVPSLPANGVAVYATLWSRISGAWVAAYSTFTESGTPTPAALAAPAPNSVLGGSSVTFTWTTGGGPTQYELWLGNTGINTNNVYNSGVVTSTAANVTGIPTSGVNLYARLWSRINGDWVPQDYLYTEAGTPALATMSTPAPGSTLPGSTVVFTWTPGAGPTQYELWLGTSLGASNLYNSGQINNSGQPAYTATATGLPANGATVYARLYSRINGNWQSIDYTYTAQ